MFSCIILYVFAIFVGNEEDHVDLVQDFEGALTTRDHTDHSMPLMKGRKSLATPAVRRVAMENDVS